MSPFSREWAHSLEIELIPERRSTLQRFGAVGRRSAAICCISDVILMFSLQKNVWGYSSNLETHTVETHIYRLRKKILEIFKDNNFINHDKYGYFID